MAVFKMLLLCASAILWDKFVVSAGRTERDLIKEITAQIDHVARPVKDIWNPITVKLTLHPVTIADLSAPDERLDTFTWLEMSWRDEYISWDPSDWNGTEYVVVPVSLIWRPDIVIRNSVDNVKGHIADEENLFRAVINHEGIVVFQTADLISTSCDIKMDYFPFDDQACFIHIDSWTYDARQLQLQNTSQKIPLNIYETNGQWDILDTDTLTYVENVDGRNYYEMKFIFYLRRQPLFYIVNLVAPVALLSFLIIPVFLLSAESGEKVSLSMTILLTFSVFQLLIADSMPKTSTALPLIGLYVIVTMILAGLSLLCSVLVIKANLMDPEIPPPRHLRMLYRRLAKAFCMRLPEQLSEQPPTEAVRNDINGSPAQKCAAEPAGTADYKGEWVFLAKALDRLFLVIFCVLVIASFVLIICVYPFTKPDKPSVA